MSPIRASLSRTPTASGLSAPLASFAGPRPRKTSRPVPAKTCAATSALPILIVPSVKLTLPSIVTKSPMVKVASEMLRLKVSVPSAKDTLSVRPPTSTLVSIGSPVVLTCSSALPEMDAPPADAAAVPDR
jgi:hypothetical protein